MKTIAEAVGVLVQANCPVLCLDTCVFLDVITTGNRGEADLIGVNRVLLQVLVTTPDRLRIVVTELVDDFNKAGLLFLGRLPLALRHMGILS